MEFLTTRKNDINQALLLYRTLKLPSITGICFFAIVLHFLSQISSLQPLLASNILKLFLFIKSLFKNC